MTKIQNLLYNINENQEFHGQISIRYWLDLSKLTIFSESWRKWDKQKKWLDPNIWNQYADPKSEKKSCEKNINTCIDVQECIWCIYLISFLKKLVFLILMFTLRTLCPTTNFKGYGWKIWGCVRSCVWFIWPKIIYIKINFYKKINKQITEPKNLSNKIVRGIY